ncbi:ABC-2 type transport system ATP-binding protein [Pseudobutyrivibrio ruminis]|uniref:ABC-2 type transport system ATP-binding protein n=2 Tax=Pseudobutyrivibrio ruminis TaxID=46206 RepID=A0A1H7EZM0_9FIRM|nr:ABC transporter ATP-binding protein [Pseudobutyrivibrio ruminis]SEK19218.1 ABC-2 type transport system ATP-binding protein [Pseudobutyrivibrio ruminis]SOC01459.1 ABC-2 type transport system ATP-binding protein [Pseudobutyrivibrio ruminis DSM 9787]
MLKSVDVTKKFVGKTAVDGITMSLEPGHIYAMLGPNGSGKTTWMKMAAGLIKPTSGEVLYKDTPIGIESRKEIAYMSTEPYFYDWMTVGDVGKYYKDFFADFSMDNYTDMVISMDLDMKQKVKSLSSGMMAKLKVAVTMARDAKVYMLDEPLNGIDLLARDEVMNMILDAASEDKILLISSHLVEELESVVDKAIFIKQAQLVGVFDVEGLRMTEGVSLADKYRQVFSNLVLEGIA